MKIINHINYIMLLTFFICALSARSSHIAIPSGLETMTEIPESSSVVSYDSEDSYKNLKEQIKSGNFSSLANEDEWALPNLSFILDDSQFYNDFHNKQLEDMEWVEYDINKDGINELIYQQKYGRFGELAKSITAIFSFVEHESKVVLLDVIDKDYYFISPNGNIVYHNWSYGTVNWDGYTLCKLNEELSIERVRSLGIRNVEEWYINELKEDCLFDELIAEQPYLAEAGYYYYKSLIQSNGELGEPIDIDKEHFQQEFEEMVGVSICDMKPDAYAD